MIITSNATPRVDLGAAFMEYSASADRYIATKVLAPIMVQEQSGYFASIDRESFGGAEALLRTSKSNYGRSEMRKDDKSFSCREYGWEELVGDDEVRKFASQFDLEVAAAQRCADTILVGQEIRTAAALFNTTTFATGNGNYTDDSSGYPWATSSTDIRSRINAHSDTVRLRTGIAPNALIISKGNLNRLMANDDIVNSVQYVRGADYQTVYDEIARYLGLEYLMVGMATKRTSDEGLAWAGSNVWSDTYASLAVIATPGAGISTPCVGRTFMWEPDAGSEVVVETYREEEKRATVVRARQHVDNNIIDNGFAHLIKVA